jgi:hypothetical protein
MVAGAVRRDAGDADNAVSRRSVGRSLRAMTTARHSRTPAGAQVIVDTKRLWHAVFHAGSAPRYCLITSWESGAAPEDFIDKHQGRTTIDSLPVSDDMIAAAKAAIDRQKWQRRAERLRWELRRLIARLNGGGD